jgi:hypothetical protein
VNVIEINTLREDKQRFFKLKLLVCEFVLQIERDETKQEKSGKLFKKSGQVRPVP